MGGTRIAPPSIVPGGVLQAAFYAKNPAFSAGNFISIFGTYFLDRTAIWDTEFVDGQAPTSLGGLQVLVDGKPAYIRLIRSG